MEHLHLSQGLTIAIFSAPKQTVKSQGEMIGLGIKAQFKRRILHASNRIAELSTCKMRRLNQLYVTCFNAMPVS